MLRNPTADWMKLAHDGYALWAESMMVVGMRTTDMMTGKGSADENLLMVTEKMQASAELAVMLATGALTSPQQNAHKAVRHYRKRVRANRKRLSRTRP
ncbi:hypothetical protein WSK_3208 [Novosphingobium sp. Rr 2-17]|uniref:hypothetical protein n=1 Tax=Novosphingobium sp. Rr 2-17 TaxID=555793 RepID=UPI00026988C0|nr:hypothetical protein [Novosphingobium sp. Rr 2-17]EIZ78233.1 hypothetical protein WSK_3208 [Novosphingobium sp. Rr 2-17]